VKCTVKVDWSKGAGYHAVDNLSQSASKFSCFEGDVCAESPIGDTKELPSSAVR
jgi:hypothetical protein